MKMEMTSESSATTQLRRRERVKQGKQDGQMLPTAEVIITRENETGSRGCNKALKEMKERAGQGKTDAPNSGGHYEKRK